MSQTTVLLFGLISFIFLVGGISFTLREVRLKHFRKSDYFFLAAAIISFIFANYLWFFVNKEFGTFVGIWVPSNLALGLYFRMMSSRSKKHQR